MTRKNDMKILKKEKSHIWQENDNTSEKDNFKREKERKKIKKGKWKAEKSRKLKTWKTPLMFYANN